MGALLSHMDSRMSKKTEESCLSEGGNPPILTGRRVLQSLRRRESPFRGVAMSALRDERRSGIQGGMCRRVLCAVTFQGREAR